MSLWTRFRIRQLHARAVRRRRRCYRAELQFRRLVKAVPDGVQIDTEVAQCPALTLLSVLDPDGFLGARAP